MIKQYFFIIIVLKGKFPSVKIFLGLYPSIVDPCVKKTCIFDGSRYLSCKSNTVCYIAGTSEYFDKIQYNGNSENGQHDKLLFLRFDYSLVIIRNEKIFLMKYCIPNDG